MTSYIIAILIIQLQLALFVSIFGNLYTVFAFFSTIDYYCFFKRSTIDSDSKYTVIDSDSKYTVIDSQNYHSSLQNAPLDFFMVQRFNPKHSLIQITASAYLRQSSLFSRIYSGLTLVAVFWEVLHRSRLGFLPQSVL